MTKFCHIKFCFAKYLQGYTAGRTYVKITVYNVYDWFIYKNMLFGITKNNA